MLIAALEAEVVVLIPIGSTVGSLRARTDPTGELVTWARGLGKPSAVLLA